MVNLLKILADVNRLRILKMLETKPLCVCEMAAVLKITQPSVSRHVRKLKEFGLIAEEQNGFYTDYRLVKPSRQADRALVDTVLNAFARDPQVSADRQVLRNIDRTKIC